MYHIIVWPEYLFIVYICSIRVLPHLQNTGGFFIAVLQKTAELPWVAARTIKKTTDGRLKYYNFQTIGTVTYPFQTNGIFHKV